MLTVDLLTDDALPAAWKGRNPRLCKMSYHAPPANAFGRVGEDPLLETDGVSRVSHDHYVHRGRSDRFEALGAFRVAHPWPGRSYEEQQRRFRRMQEHVSRETARLSIWQRPPGRHDMYWPEGARLHLLGGAGEKVRRHAAALRIQASWRRAMADPGHALCRRRLLREFEAMCGHPMCPRLHALVI